ncbi:TadE/TadG family type IV pilus assembly protein [Bradyrhizobium prioriisuperbiae]|uniref:TadE/TadG family type IV pilus assembly protein n=1 Tax=Bradyrhizobium prioriisuperbiae TaxID=2854389 RepID=UPI0028EA596A|nr:TadE/TadG family type IV pilus assembly protein [Bradyrhizobium prioritasuperba]
MSSCVRSRSAVNALLCRFRNGEQGSSAVEFAIVAPIFLALTVAIAELAMVFFAGQYLETAVQDSARLIMTGQAQTAAVSYTADTFKTQVVCPRLNLLIDCNNLSIDIQSFSSFTGIDPGSPVDATNNIKSKFLFDMGSPTSTVLVRAFYPWQLMTARMFDISNLADGKYLIQASAAFRNEPYNNQ